MAIKTTVYETDFVQMLMGDDYAHWTVEEARALYAYYDELSDDMGEDLEISRVDVRCEWSSYKDFNAIKEAYSNTELESVDDLRELKTVIELDTSILMGEF